MRRPARGKPEDDREADDPTLIRVPQPDEDGSEEPDADSTGDRAEEEDGDPAGISDRD